MASTEETQTTETETPAKPKASKAATAKLAREYFNAVVNDRDLSAYDRLWARDGTWQINGMHHEPLGTDGARAFFSEIFESIPDLGLEIIEVVADGKRAVVHWRMTGTFAGKQPFQGIEPNGARLDIRGIDILSVEDGKITELVGYADNMQIARQLGALPPADSPAEQRMMKLVNARSRMLSRMVSAPEKVAEGVWVLRGGFPMKTMNVYLIEERDGVTVFDAGIRVMTNAIAAAATNMGGIKRVVLGHGHADHRGAAPGLAAEVFCHAKDRADAEGDGGEHYFDFSKLNPLAKRLMPKLLQGWDGGPVEIAGTVKEGDDVAGFKVIELPGHSPGLIGLWRESDRLALVSDCFYTLDPQTGRKGHPRVPHHAFNADTEQARESIRKLAAMEPAAAWAGHADPVVGDVRAQLETAAATT
ncbi:MAG TPA: ester cyclase [Solirubrobacteraceae bacterium]|jgi:steroid delta-isomerase-like uncharacterized protein